MQLVLQDNAEEGQIMNIRWINWPDDQINITI